MYLAHTLGWTPSELAETDEQQVLLVTRYITASMAHAARHASGPSPVAERARSTFPQRSH